MSKLIFLITLIILAFSTAHYHSQNQRLQEQLCIINSLLDLADARIEKLTAVPHKGVRKHLRKDGEVR